MPYWNIRIHKKRDEVMRFVFDDAAFSSLGGDWLCLKVPKADALYFLENKKPVKYTAEIKPYRKRRSLDANAACWQLCQNIAEAVGNTKEDVYRAAIRDVGPFTYLAVKEDALDMFTANWESGGIGRIVQVVADSKWDGYIKVMCYFGSSTYDTETMSTLINHLNDEAKDVGAETLVSSEMKRVLDEWERRND
jgi:hypothetical protein